MNDFKGLFVIVSMSLFKYKNIKSKYYYIVLNFRFSWSSIKGVLLVNCWSFPTTKCLLHMWVSLLIFSVRIPSYLQIFTDFFHFSISFIGFENLINLTPFIDSLCAYLESLLQTPNQQCFVASFLLKLAISNNNFTENVKNCHKWTLLILKCMGGFVRKLLVCTLCW